MKQEILNRFTREVIFSGDYDSLKTCVEDAVRRGISLDGASLNGASLDRASFKDTTIFNNIKINKAPVFINGLHWMITLMDHHINIGCKLHTIDEWENFDNESINKMDKSALRWWIKNKQWIIEMARVHESEVDNASE